MKKQKLSSPDLVVMSFLAEEPMHGYRIVSELHRRDAKDWATISRPQVYYSLTKLAKLKLIEIASDTDSFLGPEREKYRINSKGLKAMTEALIDSSWSRQRPPPPFLTWIALSSHLSANQTRELIKERKSFLKKELDRERATMKEFQGNSDKMIIAGRLMVALTIEQFESELKWLERVSVELPKSRS